MPRHDEAQADRSRRRACRRLAGPERVGAQADAVRGAEQAAEPSGGVALEGPRGEEARRGVGQVRADGGEGRGVEGGLRALEAAEHEGLDGAQRAEPPLFEGRQATADEQELGALVPELAEGADDGRVGHVERAGLDGRRPAKARLGRGGVDGADGDREDRAGVAREDDALGLGRVDAEPRPEPAHGGVGQRVPEGSGEHRIGGERARRDHRDLLEAGRGHERLGRLDGDGHVGGRGRRAGRRAARERAAREGRADDAPGQTTLSHAKRRFFEPTRARWRAPFARTSFASVTRA